MRATWFLKAALLMPLVWCCALQRSSESETKLSQQVDEGAWTRETWEYAPNGTHPDSGEPHTAGGGRIPSGVRLAGAAARPPQAEGPLILHSIEKHEPSTTSTNAAVDEKEARSARFGFSPWQWALGALVGLAGLWGLVKLKSKLSL